MNLVLIKNFNFFLDFLVYFRIKFLGLLKPNFGINHQKRINRILNSALFKRYLNLSQNGK